VKKYGLEKTDRATKTSLFDRKWRYSLSNRCSSIKQTDHHDITEKYGENGVYQP
jgi:hypothetical protein